MSPNAPRGHAVLSLADLRELLADPDSRSRERQLHFRILLNGRVLREFRQFAFAPHTLMPVDLTWLLGEIAQHPTQPIDLRLELTPET